MSFWVPSSDWEVAALIQIEQWKRAGSFVLNNDDVICRCYYFRFRFARKITRARVDKAAGILPNEHKCISGHVTVVMTSTGSKIRSFRPRVVSCGFCVVGVVAVRRSDSDFRQNLVIQTKDELISVFKPLGGRRHFPSALPHASDVISDMVEQSVGVDVGVKLLLLSVKRQTVPGLFALNTSKERRTNDWLREESHFLLKEVA